MGSYTPYALLALLLVGFQMRGVWLAGPAIVFLAVIPSLDLIFGEDLVSFSIDDFLEIQIRLCRLAPYGFIVGYVVLFFVYARIAGGLRAWEFFLATTSMGAVASINVAAAHELIHKHSRLAKGFGRLGFCFVAYMHFEYLHLFGHHRDAGTEEDNHTAWYGEAFGMYLIRTVRDAIAFCNNFENARLKRRGINTLSLQNRLLWFLCLPVVLSACLFISLGWLSVLFYFGQALIAIVSLEAVSYIEHYGLMRDRAGSGYDPMDNRHSWNSYHRFSNYLTFMLQRHSEHHLKPTKDYFLLGTNGESPKLPVGYPLLILLMLSNKYWRKTIDPLLPRTPAPNDAAVAAQRPTSQPFGKRCA